MLGKRFTLAASVSLVGVSFLFAQQGESLPNQEKVTPSTAPASPVPGTVPTTPASPGGQVIPSAPGQTAPTPRDIPTTPGQPVPRVPTQVQPGTQPQPQPRSIDNGQQANDQAQQMPDEAKFLVKAAEIDLAEINIGRLAAMRASRPDIRQFANKLVQDHSANLNQVNQLANRNNWKSGERMDQEHQQLFQKLAVLQGPKFDQEFLQNMVAGHKKAAEVFQHASEHCKNADIKQFATQTLAAVRQHEQEAQRLMGQNQPQTTQPTSTENNNNPNRTDGSRIISAPNDNQ